MTNHCYTYKELLIIVKFLCDGASRKSFQVKDGFFNEKLELKYKEMQQINSFGMSTKLETLNDYEDLLFRILRFAEELYWIGRDSPLFDPEDGTIPKWSEFCKFLCSRGSFGVDSMWNILLSPITSEDLQYRNDLLRELFILGEIQLLKLGIRIGAIEEVFKGWMGRGMRMRDVLHGVNGMKHRKKGLPPHRYNLSFCCDYQIFRSENPTTVDLVGVADTFISYAQNYPVDTFVRCVQRLRKRRPNAILWIDLFSHNQYCSILNKSHFWRNRLNAVIHHCDCIVLLFDNIKAPECLERTWCLTEIVSAVRAQKPLTIEVDELHQNDYLGKIEINFSESKCEYVDDKLFLKESVSEFGFTTINRMVQNVIYDWKIFQPFVTIVFDGRNLINYAFVVQLALPYSRRLTNLWQSRDNLILLACHSGTPLLLIMTLLFLSSLEISTRKLYFSKVFSWIVSFLSVIVLLVFAIELVSITINCRLSTEYIYSVFLFDWWFTGLLQKFLNSVVVQHNARINQFFLTLCQWKNQIKSFLLEFRWAVELFELLWNYIKFSKERVSNFINSSNFLVTIRREVALSTNSFFRFVFTNSYYWNNKDFLLQTSIGFLFLLFALVFELDLMFRIASIMSSLRLIYRFQQLFFNIRQLKKETYEENYSKEENITSNRLLFNWWDFLLPFLIALFLCFLLYMGINSFDPQRNNAHFHGNSNSMLSIDRHLIFQLVGLKSFRSTSIKTLNVMEFVQVKALSIISFFLFNICFFFFFFFYFFFFQGFRKDFRSILAIADLSFKRFSGSDVLSILELVRNVILHDL
jgi:hypothetical protein